MEFVLVVLIKEIPMRTPVPFLARLTQRARVNPIICRIIFGLLLVLPLPANGFELSQYLVSSTITENPIEVIIWIKPGVTSADKQRVLEQIGQGLRMLEVPTSRIRFTITDVIHSTTQPVKQPNQILIIIGNGADLTRGGASLPWTDGNPGTWFGALADDPSLDLRPVTAHEIGHAIGLLHSTISVAYPAADRPIMHWARSSSIHQDDIAALSSAYPNPALSLLDVGGAIRGRIVDQATGNPVSGVNVVAVNTISGKPVVARLSGAGLSDPKGGPGIFELKGLPPGKYRIDIRDGHSYRGQHLKFDDGGGYPPTLRNFQTDNFSDFSIGPFSVSVGQELDVADIKLRISDLSIDQIHIGPIDYDNPLQLGPIGNLPSAQAGQLYEVWLRIQGGERGLTADVSGLPCGLRAGIALNPDIKANNIRGQHFIRIYGTPQESGDFSLNMRITDQNKKSLNRNFKLSVGGNRSPCTFDVAPSGGLISSGKKGGPFNPYSKTYTLTNTGTHPINFSVAKSSGWFAISRTEGSLRAGQSTTVKVCLKISYNLPPGNKLAEVTFTDTTNGNRARFRAVDVFVSLPPEVPHTRRTPLCK